MHDLDNAPQPLIKWAGGKSWLARYIAAKYDVYRSYRRHLGEPDPIFVEPFAGGMACALMASPPVAVINDINPWLINFYRHVRGGKVIFPPEWTNSRLAYNTVRAQFNAIKAKGITILDRAELSRVARAFYYLNKTGFRGLYRENRKGEFNVPWGAYKHYRTDINFTPHSEVMRQWLFSMSDFEMVATQPTDFIYCDPPYVESFDKYSPDGFSWSDHERLAAWAADHPGMVVLSNLDTPQTKLLYEQHGFQLDYLQAPRRISADGNREPVWELLAIKHPNASLRAEAA